MRQVYAQWMVDASYDIVETVSIGRTIVTIDAARGRAELRALYIGNVGGMGRYYDAPHPDWVIATKAWLDSYQGIPYEDYMKKMFNE